MYVIPQWFHGIYPLHRWIGPTVHAIILTTITPEAILRSQQVGVGAVIAVAVIILIIGAAVEHDHRMWERSKKMSLKRRKPTGLIWLANFFFAPEENARNKE